MTVLSSYFCIIQTGDFSWCRTHLVREAMTLLGVLRASALVAPRAADCPRADGRTTAALPPTSLFIERTRLTRNNQL
jgi:hypothetical protein